MLKTRIITALILAPLALAGVFFLPLQLFPFFVAGVTLLGAWEWGAFLPSKAQNSSGNKLHRVVFTISLAILMASFMILVPITHVWSNGQLHPIYQAALFIAAMWWCVSIALIFLYPKASNFWSDSEFYKGLFGQLTLIPFWIGMIALRGYGYHNDPMLGGILIVSVFAIVWGADVGAYFVGRSIGKRKLMPNVSPGKTIEGMLGGLVTAMLAIFITKSYFYNIELLPLLVLVFVTAFISVFGDLNESMLKRNSNIKDSGTILPGHGGILDRIDSLTAAIPVFALGYLLLVA